MDLISIIVPIYNSEQYLEKAILSIINQTYENIEILLLNDGSTDESLSIMEKYELKDKRVKVFSHDNRGQSYTRNRGIDLSAGEYIVFLDSDDWFELDFIEKMLIKIKDIDSDIVVCNHNIKYERDSREIICSIKEYMDGSNAFEEMMNSNITHTCWGKMFRSSLLKESEIRFIEGKTNEDLYTVSLWFLKANRVDFLGESLMVSRHREGSITNTFDNRFIDMIFILDRLKEHLEECGEFDNFKQVYNKKYQRMIIYLINYGVRMKRMDFIQKVLRSSSIKIHEFEKELLLKKDAHAMKILKINVHLYYMILRGYYRMVAKHIHLVK